LKLCTETLQSKIDDLEKINKTQEEKIKKYKEVNKLIKIKIKKKNIFIVLKLIF